VRRWMVATLMLLAAQAPHANITGPFPWLAHVEESNFAGVLQCIDGHKHTGTYVVHESWKGLEKGVRLTLYIPNDRWGPNDGWTEVTTGARYLVVADLYRIEGDKAIMPENGRERPSSSLSWSDDVQPDADYGVKWDAVKLIRELDGEPLSIRDAALGGQDETFHEFRSRCLDYLQLPPAQRELILLRQWARITFAADDDESETALSDAERNAIRNAATLDELLGFLASIAEKSREHQEAVTEVLERAGGPETYKRITNISVGARELEAMLWRYGNRGDEL